MSLMARRNTSIPILGDSISLNIVVNKRLSEEK